MKAKLKISFYLRANYFNPHCKGNSPQMWVNKMMDINNIISLDSKLTLGAHNIDNVSGNVTLRFTNGTERFVPLGQTEPIPVSPHE